MAGINKVPETLIEPQTAVVTDIAFTRITQSMVPVTIMVSNLAGVESVALLVSPDNKLTTFPLIQSGTTVTLTITNTVQTINSPMLLGVTKTATVGTAGVFLAYGETKV